MKVSKYIILAGLGMALFAGMSHAAQLEQLDLPTLPDAKLVTEINLPQGNILDSLAREYGPWLGISTLKQISAYIYDINPTKDAQEIIKFYDPTIAAQKWKTMVRSYENNQAAAILYNEQNGMLIIQIDAPSQNDRQATIVRIFGQMDPSKVSNPEGKLPDLFKRVVEGSTTGTTGSNGNNSSLRGASKIPTGQPISVPPSEKLHIKSTRSDIKAHVLGRTTAEIRLASRTDDPGELMRVEDRLVLALTPKLPVSEMLLPGAVPLFLEPTEGSVDLICGPGTDDRPVKLSIVSTSAPVTIEAFPLISGTHSIKSVSAEVNMQFSAVQGGVLSVEVTGKDLTVILPKDASARIQASATSGKVDNQTGVQPQSSAPDHMTIQMGSGKADITLRAINGDVRIKSSN